MDVDRFVVGLLDPHTARLEQLLVDLGDLGLEGVHDLDHVGSGLAANRQSQHEIAAGSNERILFLVAADHVGHVGNPHRSAGQVGDHRVGHLIEPLVPAHRAEGEIPLALGDRPGRHVHVMPPQGLLHVAKGQLPGRQPGGIDPNLNFPLTSAPHVDRRHPLGPLEHRLDLILGKVHQRGHVRLGSLENQPGDRRIQARLRRHHGRLVGLVRIVLDLPKLVGNVAQSGVLVRPDEEFQHDAAPPLARSAGHLPHVGHTLELLFLTFDDLPLDLLRAGPEPPRGHRHPRPVHVRRQLNRNPKNAQKPEQKDQQHPHRHFDRVIDGETDQPHGVFL